MEQDKRHIPHSSREPHNEQTKPAGTQDVDKLRENPHNDERVISQEEAKRSDADLKSNSTFSRKDDEGMNRVTNEQEQNEVVNPGPQRIESAKRDDDDDDDDEDDDDKKIQPTGPEIPMPATEPETNPYEEIGDDPETTRKKIPKM
jgi:hypothetical protein